MFVPRQVVLAKNQLSQSKQLTGDGIELGVEKGSSALAGKIDKLLESQAKVVTKLDNLLETLTRDQREARIEKSIEALRQTLVEILGRLTTGTGGPSAAAAVDATSDPRDIDLVTSQSEDEEEEEDDEDGSPGANGSSEQRLSYPAAVATAVDDDDDDDDEEEDDDEDEDDEEVDENGIDPQDIDLIMTQVGVSRAMACKALKTHSGDIVSAVMELTT